MKGKKCIKFLTFFITLVLSFVSFSNDTNAIEFAQQSSWASADWKYYPGNIAQSQNMAQNFFISNINMNASPSHPQSSLQNLNLHLRNDIQISRKYKFKFSIVFRAVGDGLAYSGGAPICPRGYNNVVFDKCEVSNTNQDTINRYFYEYTGSSPTQYSFNSNTVMYNIMDIEGHYNSDERTNVSTIETSGPIYFYYKTDTSQVDFDLRLDMLCSRLIVFTDETPEEQMNNKDNEDRDNLESQSSDTDSEANEQGDEATETGTSLFGAFTQLLTALTNINGNNCTLPAMQVYSLNLGNMNLCEYNIPPQIMALVSIGMVFIIIPLGINLVKRMVSLYKEIIG